MATTAPDDFDFLLVGSNDSKLPFLGYNSTLDPTNKAPNLMDRGSQNVYRTPAGTIANRPGRLLYDVSDSTIAGVKAGYVWNTSKGEAYPVRIANSKYQFLSDISGTKTWYDLLTGLTLTRGVWDTYWNTTMLKDQLIMVIGNRNLYVWHGGVALFVSATATVITLDRDATEAGFATSGSVTINGTSYTYTGISGSTLTGAQDASANAANSVAFSTLITTADSPTSSSTFTNDFIKVNNNQLAVGSYNSRTVHISTNASYSDFSTEGTPRVPGNKATLTLDNNVNGIAVRDGKFHISAGYSDWYVIEFVQITVGSTLSENVNVSKQPTALGAAAYAHEMIDVINDTLVFLSKDQQLRAFGTFRNLNQPAYPLLSQAVSTELKDVDFTLGQLKCIADKDRGITTYIVAPNTGTVYLHQTILGVDGDGNIVSERFWQPPFVWGISRIDVIGTVVYGFSNSNPQMYQLWDTEQWHDDSPSGDTAYTSILVMPYRGGRRGTKVRFDKTYWEGYMTQGTRLYGLTYFDYQGATGVLNPFIHSIIDDSEANDQSFFSGIVPPSIGDASLGSNPLGDLTKIVGLGNTTLTDHDLMPKFRVVIGSSVTDCYEYALGCYSLDLDARWEIICLGANTSVAPFEGVELVKTTS